MGLDVYLNKYKNFDDTIKKEKDYSRYCDELWEKEVPDYDSASDEEKDNVRKKCDEFASILGLSKYGIDEKNVDTIEISSKTNPEHLFKIGYFRSSYNESGIDVILSNLGLPTLSEIFEVKSEDYYLQPDWKKVIDNLNDVIDKFSKAHSFRVHHIMDNIFGNHESPTTKKEALDLFLEELNKTKASVFKDEESGFSNINGDFYINKPLEVVALIPGTYELFSKNKCTYIITKSDNTWYIEALKIMKETCEYVLSQDDPTKYYLHWSG